MQPVQTFDNSLSALMKKHRITISELTRRLRIKSNTTLSRVLHAQCSPQAAEHFLKALQDANPPVFDAQELQELSHALDVTRIGVAAYCANQEMWQLLENDTTPSTPFPIESYGAGRFVNTTQLREF
jgi:transcriptional regulator with XRE-family HTH domain